MTEKIFLAFLLVTVLLAIYGGLVMESVKRVLRTINVLFYFPLMMVGAYYGVVIGVNVSRWFEPTVVETRQTSSEESSDETPDHIVPLARAAAIRLKTFSRFASRAIHAKATAT